MLKAVRSVALVLMAIISTVQPVLAQAPDRRPVDALRKRTWAEELIGRTQSFAPRSLTTSVQKHLTQLGIYSGPQDGKLSPELSRAIMAYQKSKDMAANGWVTYDLLDSIEGREPVRATIADPVIALPPEPPPPPPPPAKDWNLKSVTGKSVHAQAGDLLGRVRDVLLGNDGQVGGLVVGIVNRYGDDKGDTLIDWKMVGAAASKPAIILLIPADKAAEIRRNPAPFKLETSQLLASKIKVEGRLQDVAFDADGKVLHAVVSDGDNTRLIPLSELFGQPKAD